MLKKIKNYFKKLNKKQKTTYLVILVVLVVGLFVFLLIDQASMLNKIKLKQGVLQDQNDSYNEALTGSKDGKELSGEQIKAAYERSISELKTKTKQNPNDINSLLKLASSYYNTGKLDEAITTLERALEIDGNNYLTHNNIANFYREKGDMDKALEHYDQAINLNPMSEDAYVNKAILLYDYKNDKEGALNTLKQGLVQIPDSKSIGVLLDQLSR